MVTAPDGAYIVGGGEWKYGQSLTEELAHAMLLPPMPTPLNALALIADNLSRLPLEALKVFQPFVPDSDDAMFVTIEAAVETIIGIFTDPIGTVSEFLEKFSTFLGTIVNLDAWLVIFKQIIDFFVGIADSARAVWLGVFKSVVDTFVTLSTTVGTNLWTVLSGVVTTFSTLFTSLGTPVWTVVNQIITFFSGIAATTRAAWLDVFKKVIDAFAGILNIDTWLAVLKQVINFFVGITEATRTAWLGVFKQVIDFFGTITNLSTWTAAIKTLIDGVLGITNFDAWVGVFTKVVDTFVTLANTVGTNIWVVLSGVVTTFGTLFASLNTKVWAVIQDIITFFSGVVTDPGKTLTDWLLSIPIIGDVVYAITRVGEGDGWQPGDGLTFLSTWIKDNLLTQTTKLPIGGITTGVTNLLGTGKFETISELSPTDGWVWDSTQSATGTGGSAKVVLDGFNKQMVYRDPITVVAGTTLRFTAKVKTASVTGVAGYGWNVTLSAIPFVGTAIGGPVRVASRTASASDWVDIGGNYTVPAGVTKVSFQLGVETASAGTVWFDELQCYNNDVLPQKGIQNLTDAWEGMWSGQFGDGTGLGKTWADMGTNIRAGRDNTTLAQGAGDTAHADLRTTRNSMYDGFTLGAGATGKTAADLGDFAKVVRQQADLGVGNAGLANGAAVIADGKAVTADGKAVDVATGLRTTVGGETGVGVPANSGAYLGNLIKKMYGTGASIPQEFINNVALKDIPFTKMTGSLSGANITSSTIPVTALDANVVPGITATVKASTVGSGLSMNRTSAGPAYSTLFGQNRLTTGFYDSVINSTSDFQVVNPGGFVGIKTLNAGWYVFELGYQLTQTNVPYRWDLTPILYKSDTAGNGFAGAKWGTNVFYLNFVGTDGKGSKNVQNSFVEYMEAGQIVYPGYLWSNNASPVTASANIIAVSLNGFNTYFSGSLLNRSLA
jgi:hypothetical protein